MRSFLHRSDLICFCLANVFLMRSQLLFKCFFFSLKSLKLAVSSKTFRIIHDRKLTRPEPDVKGKPSHFILS